MTGQTVVALAALVVTALVSLYVPRYTAERTERRERERADREDLREAARADREEQREQRRFQQERSSRDLEEVRSLLDDFVASIAPAVQSAASVQGAWADAGRRGDFGPEAYKERIAQFTAARERLIALQTRLIVRLGRRHAVVHSAQAVIETVEQCGGTATTGLVLEQTPPRDTPDVWIPGRQAMWDARHAFIDSAQSLVGARID